MAANADNLCAVDAAFLADVAADFAKRCARRHNLAQQARGNAEAVKQTVCP